MAAARRPFYLRATQARIAVFEFIAKASTIRAEGMWTCADGRQVLFNRYYRPIYERHPGQRGRPVDRDEWVPWVNGAAACKRPSPTF
jgi:hypothetical protein